jgi:ribonucleoside-diphosphate reductase alpha chain
MWGRKGGYFGSDDEQIFCEELKWLLVNQVFAFNSPVWYNVGIEDKPQTSACFILSVDDHMDSILDLVKIEGTLFKWGSGCGTNISTLRGSTEKLSGGGVPSGPISFMKGYDTFAGIIKSGGKTRRAAKMTVLDVDHPDIVDFVWCKAKEEKKVKLLIDGGFSPEFNVPDNAYDSAFFQHTNHSVRVTDEFMRRASEGGTWETIERTTGKASSAVSATRLLHDIAEAAWVCGDPGIQFHDTTNKWHTCKNSGPIRASNPCGEFVVVDDLSCNLASLNLLQFVDSKGNFDTNSFSRAIDVVILAQEILVDNSSYPTQKVEANSHAFRPLGLGYANLGAVLMSWGVPYDSDEGRNVAAAITSLMTACAYFRSQHIGRKVGPFPKFEENCGPMMEVIANHASEAKCCATSNSTVPRFWDDIINRAVYIWNCLLLDSNRPPSFRNCQVTLLAPTGTIGFLMDCTTTGIEPDIALVKYKKMVGGGMMKFVNGVVSTGLCELGYTTEEIAEILVYIKEHDTIEGAPQLRAEHLPVFDCAFTSGNGKR